MIAKTANGVQAADQSQALAEKSAAWAAIRPVYLLVGVSLSRRSRVLAMVALSRCRYLASRDWLGRRLFHTNFIAAHIFTV